MWAAVLLLFTAIVIRLVYTNSALIIYHAVKLAVRKWPGLAVTRSNGYDNICVKGRVLLIEIKQFRVQRWNKYKAREIRLVLVTPPKLSHGSTYKRRKRKEQTLVHSLLVGIAVPTLSWLNFVFNVSVIKVEATVAVSNVVGCPDFIQVSGSILCIVRLDQVSVRSSSDSTLEIGDFGFVCKHTDMNTTDYLSLSCSKVCVGTALDLVGRQRERRTPQYLFSSITVRSGGADKQVTVNATLGMLMELVRLYNWYKGCKSQSSNDTSDHRSQSSSETDLVHKITASFAVPFDIRIRDPSLPWSLWLTLSRASLDASISERMAQHNLDPWDVCSELDLDVASKDVYTKSQWTFSLYDLQMINRQVGVESKLKEFELDHEAYEIRPERIVFSCRGLSTIKLDYYRILPSVRTRMAPSFPLYGARYKQHVFIRFSDSFVPLAPGDLYFWFNVFLYIKRLNRLAHKWYTTGCVDNTNKVRFPPDEAFNLGQDPRWDSLNYSSDFFSTVDSSWTHFVSCEKDLVEVVVDGTLLALTDPIGVGRTERGLVRYYGGRILYSTSVDGTVIQARKSDVFFVHLTHPEEKLTENSLVTLIDGESYSIEHLLSNGTVCGRANCRVFQLCFPSTSPRISASISAARFDFSPAPALTPSVMIETFVSIYARLLYTTQASTLVRRRAACFQSVPSSNQQSQNLQVELKYVEIEGVKLFVSMRDLNMVKDFSGLSGEALVCRVSSFIVSMRPYTLHTRGIFDTVELSGLRCFYGKVARLAKMNTSDSLDITAAETKTLMPLRHTGSGYQCSFQSRCAEGLKIPLQPVTEAEPALVVEPRLLAVVVHKCLLSLPALVSEYVDQWHEYDDIIFLILSLVKDNAFGPLVDYPPHLKKLYRLLSRKTHVSLSPFIHQAVHFNHISIRGGGGKAIVARDRLNKDDFEIAYAAEPEGPSACTSTRAARSSSLTRARRETFESYQSSNKGFFVPSFFNEVIKIPQAQSFLSAKIDSWLRRLKRNDPFHATRSREFTVKYWDRVAPFNGHYLMSLVMPYHRDMWDVEVSGFEFKSTSTMHFAQSWETATWKLHKLIEARVKASDATLGYHPEPQPLLRSGFMSVSYDVTLKSVSSVVQHIEVDEFLESKPAPLKLLHCLYSLFQEALRIAHRMPVEASEKILEEASDDEGTIIETFDLRLSESVALTFRGQSNVRFAHEGRSDVHWNLYSGLFIRTNAFLTDIWSSWEVFERRLLTIPPLKLSLIPDAGIEVYSSREIPKTPDLWISSSLFDLIHFAHMAKQIWTLVEETMRLVHFRKSERVEKEDPTDVAPFKMALRGVSMTLDSFSVLCDYTQVQITDQQRDISINLNSLQIIVQGERDFPELTKVAQASLESGWQFEDARVMVTDVTTTVHLASLGEALRPLCLLMSFLLSQLATNVPLEPVPVSEEPLPVFKKCPTSFLLSGLLIHLTPQPVSPTQVDLGGLLSQLRHVYFRGTTVMSFDPKVLRSRLPVLKNERPRWMGTAFFLQFLRVYAPIPVLSLLPSDRDPSSGWWININQIGLEKDVGVGNPVVCECPVDPLQATIKVAATGISLVWLASPLGPDSVKSLKHFFNSNLQTCPSGERFLRSILQLSLSAQLQVCARLGHFHALISKTFCALNRRDFLNLTSLIESAKTCHDDLFRLSHRMLKKKKAKNNLWHLHCFQLRLGQGSVTLESNGGELKADATPRQSADFSPDVLNEEEDPFAKFIVMVNRLAPKAESSVRHLMRCLFGNLVVTIRWEVEAKRTKINVDVGDVLIQSTTEKSNSNEATISLAPLGAYTEEVPVLAWRAAALVEEQTVDATTTSKKVKRSRLKIPHSSSLSDLEGSGPVEARTVYEFVQLQIQPLLIDLSQQFLIELMAFFSTEDEEQDKLMASWQDAEAKLIGDATEIQQSLETATSGDTGGPFTRIVKQESSSESRSKLTQVVLKLKGAADGRNTTLVKDLKIYPLHMSLSYQGILNVQDAFVHLPEISTQNIYTDALSTLVYRDLSWEVIKQVVSQVLSSKVKSMVGKVSAHRRWKGSVSRDDVDPRLTRRRRRFSMLHRGTRLETADQMIQGFLQQKKTSSQHRSRRERFLASALHHVSGTTPQASFDKIEGCSAPSVKTHGL